jgi:hypothetical protein
MSGLFGGGNARAKREAADATLAAKMQTQLANEDAMRSMQQAERGNVPSRRGRGLLLGNLSAPRKTKVGE